MLNYISIKATDYFVARMTLSETDQLKMTFGFENLFHQLSQFILIGAVAGILGILPACSLYFIVFGMDRLIAGGFHLKTSLGCTIVTTSIIVGGTKLALAIQLSTAWLSVIYVVMLMVVVVCAPKRTANYPVGKKEYMQLKLKSAGIIILGGIISFFICSPFRELITVALMAETLTLLPKTH